jgi:hypothetical protein
VTRSGSRPRASAASEWDDDTYDEMPYDFDRTRRYFEAANAAVPT